MGWWKEEHFNASDADSDGLLNITEFNDFLHPADTNNPKLLLWLCKEEIRNDAYCPKVWIKTLITKMEQLLSCIV
ncbi:hypothetical protein Pfo_031029 [Paulownia fortunei]|nr:hypothetical protein Pfo_031029 [Paulownia fortunei]